jgi:predicted ATP-dependent serine protease
MRDNLMKEKHAFVYTLLDINNPFRQVDVFLSDENSYATLIAKSELLKIGGQRIRVVSVKDLISMKQKVRPRREKDGFDIKMLKKLLQ